MINRLCVGLIEKAFNQMLNGVYQVSYSALNFVCKMIISIASSIKR